MSRYGELNLQECTLRITTVVTGVAFSALCAGPGVAWAEDESMHRSPHMEDTRWIVGTKAVGVATVHAEEGSNVGAGLGLSMERNVIEGWLEVELVLAVARVGEGTSIPIDLVAKKPFHFGRLTPYLGLGLASSVHPGADRPVALGVAAVGGTYLWLGDHWGIDAELSYALLAEEGVLHEVVPALGPSFRF